MTPVRVLAPLLAVVAGLGGARAETMVISLSTPMVGISSTFAGSEVTLFGSIEPPAGAAMPDKGYDVAVALVGPRRTIVARRKERVLGLWVNRHRWVFGEAPAFYSLSSTLPVAMITTPEEAQRLHLGLARLPLQGPAHVEAAEILGAADAREAVLRLQQKHELYAEYPTRVSFLGPHLFATTISIPADVPVGHYEAQVTAFAEGRVVAEETADLLVVKFGFEQSVADLAENHATFYGLMSVVLALFTGWIGGVLFRRD